MKIAVTLYLSWLATVYAAPALVWKESSSAATVHHSEDVSIQTLMRNTFENSESIQVVFLLGRQENGKETLSALTSSGALPEIASRAESATCIHHHVSNVQNAQSVTAMANAVAADKLAVKVSLDEFSAKMHAIMEPQEDIMQVASSGMVSKAAHVAKKRSRELTAARTLIVDVPGNTSPQLLESNVIKAIDSKVVGSVILSSVRSVDEVKHARDMQVRYRRVLMEKEGSRLLDARRRRLQDEDNGEGEIDVSGIYYVSMTPNIFAGLLFTLLFGVTTLIGLSCMGSIQGQDTYVSKMPSVGREA